MRIKGYKQNICVCYAEGGNIMGSVVLQADTLNLPVIFAKRYHGLSLRIVDEGSRLVITPVYAEQESSIIESAQGMLKGLGLQRRGFYAGKANREGHGNCLIPKAF
jgi:hypothetical protein